jgi:hypothetical protein
VVSSRHRWNPRGIKRKMSNYPLRSAKGTKHLKPIADYVRIIKRTVLGLAMVRSPAGLRKGLV